MGGGSALAGASLAVAPARRGDAGGARHPGVLGPRGDARIRRRSAVVPVGLPPGGETLRALWPRSGREVSATRTEPATGARAVNAVLGRKAALPRWGGSGEPAAYREAWLCAHPISSLPCAASCSARSRFSSGSSRCGSDLPFAFDEHALGDGPSLYEYRPLVRGFVEEREARLRGRDDALIALAELRREPGAAIFARAHAGPKPSEDDALFRTILLGLVISTAEACGGFDWDDVAFDRVYAELEGSLFGEQRAYRAVAPVIGLTVNTQLELAPGLRIRAFADGELAKHWPEARGLLPPNFGRDADRYCVLELRAGLDAGEDPPDAAAELADSVTALRLATAAPLAAGPVLFETLDGRPFGIRPVLPIAATQPPGEPSRLDTFRGALAGELLVRLPIVDEDEALAEALDRWELSLFQNDPFRGEQLRAAFGALLGDTWPLRGALLLEDDPAARERLHADLEALAARDDPTSPAVDAARRALVQTLRHGDRVDLVRELDRALLGVGDTSHLRLAS